MAATHGQNGKGQNGKAGNGGDPEHDLPPTDTKRWVVRRKAAVLSAIGAGVLSRAEACARYRISETELRLWERAVHFAGVPGLRVTRVQIYRPVFEGKVRL